MKTLLMIAALFTTFNALAADGCLYGEKKIVKVAKATVLDNGTAKVDGSSIALSSASEGLEPGTIFNGLVIKVCYDIGHIPGVMSYWKELIIPESQILNEM